MHDTDTGARRLGHASSPAVEQALEDGVDTVVMPLGATEQHGPHLPLATDTTLAGAIADRVAVRLGDAFVAPPFPYGPSEEHAAFPGTISLSRTTLIAVLRDCVRSFDRQGFERVVLLPGHGGWFPLVEAAYPDLATFAEIRVVAVTDLSRYMGLLREGLRTAGIEAAGPVEHAGAGETSMHLAVDPDAVDDDRPCGHTGPVSPAVLFRRGVDVYAENGVIGDASKATAAAGESVLEHVADAFAAFVREEFAALETANAGDE